MNIRKEARALVNKYDAYQRKKQAIAQAKDIANMPSYYPELKRKDFKTRYQDNLD